MASISVRKIVKTVVETHVENRRPLARAHRMAVVGAVMENPYPPHYVDDVVSVANTVGHELGTLIGPAAADLLGEEVEAFGKAALVGIDGEVEHGSALVHNLRFGNVIRAAAGGEELLPAAEKTAVPGAWVDIPLKHKNDAKVRSHHQTVTFVVPDAPLPREIVIICAMANAGRPLARLADFGSEAPAEVRA